MTWLQLLNRMAKDARHALANAALRDVVGPLHGKLTRIEKKLELIHKDVSRQGSGDLFE